jgi:hypothetical protein
MVSPELLLSDRLRCCCSLACCSLAAQAEAGVLKGMKDQFRVCVATVGDGAAADPNLYDYMYGSIIIWMGEAPLQDSCIPYYVNSFQDVLYWAHGCD